MPDPLVAFGRVTRAGKIGRLNREPLSSNELRAFNEGFNTLVNKLRILDKDLAVEFEAQRHNYQIAAEIFKASTDLAFGGLQPESGQFGMSFIPPRPFLGTNTWSVSISSAGWNDLWGSSSSPISGSTTAGQQRAYYYQGILVFDGIMPDAIRFWVNGTDYPVLELEEWTIPKPFTTIRYIGLDYNVLITTTGKHYVRALFNNTGNIVAKPFGLMFAEYDYMATEGNYYT